MERDKKARGGGAYPEILKRWCGKTSLEGDFKQRLKGKEGEKSCEQ